MNIIIVISFRALLVMEREKAVNKGNFDFSSYSHMDGNHIPVKSPSLWPCLTLSLLV